MGGAKKTPTVRRKLRAKRGCKPATALGNIQDYFPKMHVPKECKLDSNGEGGLRKRKVGLLLEDMEWGSGSNPSRPKLMEPLLTDDETDQRTLSPSILGARWKTGREPGHRRVMGASKGLDLMVKDEEQGWKLPGELDMTGNQNI